MAQEAKRIAVEQERLAQQRVSEEGKQIEEIKASLDPEELKVLNEKASQLIELEHGTLKFGRETLIQIKLNELIRRRYLEEAKDDS